jgi:uncharacterized coiled-coil DUF342 family protein
MSELTDQLDTLIQKAALDGALTKTAVAQFHALVTQHDAVIEELTNLKEAHENVVTNRDALSQKLQEAQTCAEEWAGREQDLMDREGKCTELEIRKECAETRVEDHKSMVGLIFRNAVMKKGVMTPLPGLKADQYGTSHAPFAQKDDVEEEET